MDSYLDGSTTDNGDDLYQFGIASGAKIEPKIIVLIVDAHCANHSVLNVLVSESVLLCGWTYY
jgi:hypothetical protein